MSHVWDHAYKIPGEILLDFDFSHLSVSRRDQDFNNHVLTHEGHMSYVRNHTH